MAYFETLTAVSVTLCFAFPYLMDKIMRPRYEENFAKFKEMNRESYVDELESVVTILKQEKEVLNPEIGEKMDDLFNEWGQIKSDENKLNSLIRKRMYLFFGWAISIFLNLMASDSKDVMINNNIRYGNICTLFFIIVFLFSMDFSYELFSLDNKITQFKNMTQNKVIPTKGSSDSISSYLNIYREFEKKLDTVLSTITLYEKQVRYKDDSNSYVYEIDYVIPSRNNPKYIIEIKRQIRMSMVLGVGSRLNYFKEKYNSKTILIGNLTQQSPERHAQLLTEWDYLIDVDNLEEIRKILTSANHSTGSRSI